MTVEILANLKARENQRSLAAAECSRYYCSGFIKTQRSDTNLILFRPPRLLAETEKVALKAGIESILQSCS